MQPKKCFYILLFLFLLNSLSKYDIIFIYSEDTRGILYFNCMEDTIMKHIKTINKANLKETAAKGGCGKCQASCQSACKTSCTVANQKCER